MELLSSNPLSGSLKGSRKRRGYNRYDGAASSSSAHQRKNMKIVRFGGIPQRAWRIKVVPKLRWKSMTAGLSPLKLWRKLKDGYVNMMLNLAGNGTAFGEKRIPKARQLPASYAPTEFDNRLVLEIYKSLVASRELATTS